MTTHYVFKNYPVGNEGKASAIPEPHYASNAPIDPPDKGNNQRLTNTDAVSTPVVNVLTASVPG